jgi:hypothetical protein
MWLPSAIKHNKPESPNVVKSWAAEFDLIPECDLKWEAFEALKASIHALGEAYGKAFDETFAKPSGKPLAKPSGKTSPNQEQEQEQEQEQDKRQAANAALPPASQAAVSAVVQPDLIEEPPGLPPCPVKQLVALFAQRCPQLPKPRYELWKDSAGAEAMRQRWKWLLGPDAVREDQTRYATTPAEAIEWFERFFEAVSASDFLSGRSGAWRNCDLTWLMKRDNFLKVVQGNYSNDRERAAA